MGVLKGAASRLERLDAGVEAARDSLTSQAILNVTLAIGVGLAIVIGLIALGRTHD